MYTTDYCGYCRMAKDLLNRRKLAFDEIDVTNDAAQRQWLVEQTGQRTVPQIWIGAVHVGGYTDLATLDARGTLNELIASQGIESTPG
jgi:glutaredoxin 3